MDKPKLFKLTSREAEVILRETGLPMPRKAPDGSYWLTEEEWLLCDSHFTSGAAT
jgi:hypothetical protein